MMKKVLIVGAGPAGLTAAYELLQNNERAYEVTILEESESFGGISQTIKADGNYMDIGGHRFFSKNKRVTDWWSHLFTPQGRPSKDDLLLGRDSSVTEGGADPEADERVMLTRERVSRIYYNHALINYPVSLNWATIRAIGFPAAIVAGFSYMATLFHKRPEDNLENFYINRFGRKLYSMFFEGYTEKLWGRHPREISAEWGAQRVKGLSILAVLKDLFGKLFHIKNRKVETSLIEKFSYPKFGPGQLWTAAADEIRKMGGTILCHEKAVQVQRGADGNVCGVQCESGHAFECDVLISSMPVKDLVDTVADAPEEIKRVAGGLPYRDFQTVGLLLPIEKFLLQNKGKRPTLGNIAPDCWIYVQDSSVTMGRIQIFNNWSPYMVKDFDKMVWIGLEYFCAEGDTYWNMSDEDFTNFAKGELVEIGVIANTDDVVFSRRERVKKAYPAYFDTYSEFSAVREYLDGIPNLYCIGRNGQHRYNNMDHSMLTAFAAVDCITHDIADKSAIWSVNTEEEYHETTRE